MKSNIIIAAALAGGVRLRALTQVVMVAFLYTDSPSAARIERSVDQFTPRHGEAKRFVARRVDTAGGAVSASVLSVYAVLPACLLDDGDVGSRGRRLKPRRGKRVETRSREEPVGPPTPALKRWLM